MTRFQNVLCIIISMMPVAVLAFLYNDLVETPNTHIWGSGGIPVSKTTFASIVILLSVLFYPMSMLLANAMPVLTDRNKGWVRVVINILFCDLIIWLILANSQ